MLVRMISAVVFSGFLVAELAGFTQPVAMRSRLLHRSVAAESEESMMPLVGAPFEADDYPTSADEMISTYVRWCASRGETITVEEARRDIQCFMSDEETASKWRPVLQEAAKEKRKLTPTDIINTVLNYALPVAVGIVILPLLRDIADRVPFVNDVILPQVDGAVGFVKKGVQKVIELPICLEFGDC